MPIKPRTLDEQEAFFQENGFVLLENAVPADVLESLLKVSAELLESGGNHDTLRNLLALSETFEPLIDGHAGIPLLERLIGSDLQLLAMDMRTCAPGKGQMPWHVDSGFFSRGSVVTINTALYLDDLTPENGTLRLVPRSHLTPFSLTGEELQAPLPGEMVVECPAGTMVLFSDNLWHRTGANTTARPRRGIFTYYGHYWVKQCGYAEQPTPLRSMKRYFEGTDAKRRRLMGVWMDGSEFNAIE